MPNQLAFDVKITRDQIEVILSHEEVDYIVISGSSTYAGKGVWDVKVGAQGYSKNKGLIDDATGTACIQPCP